MCCGTAQNSYKTIRSIRVILHDSYILDTSDEENIKEFMQIKPNIVKGLLDLRGEMLQNHAPCDLMRRKYKIKNTTGL